MADAKSVTLRHRVTGAALTVSEDQADAWRKVGYADEDGGRKAPAKKAAAPRKRAASKKSDD